MKKQSIFWRFLVICLVGLFLISGVFYSGTAFCQVEPEEEEEMQTHPRPDTRPNPMLKGKSSQKVQADGSGGGNVATGAEMKPAAPHQQMRPAMPAQQMRPAAPMHK